MSIASRGQPNINMCHYFLTTLIVADATGEKLPDGDVEQIFKLTGIEEDLDGNIKYEGLPPICHVAKLFLCARSPLSIVYPCLSAKC